MTANLEINKKEINMSEQSKAKPSLECGHTVDRHTIDAGYDTVGLEVESAYQNISFPFTHQIANSAADEMSGGKLGKKPKPCPKPNYVALKVAELNYMVNSGGSTSKPPPTKPSQNRSPGPTPSRPPPVDKPSKLTDFRNLSSSDDHLYDTAATVQPDVLQRISEGMASADVPKKLDSSTSITIDSPVSKTMPIYAKPNKRVKQEEPIYDEAIAVVLPEDEGLYDEAIAVHPHRIGNTVFEESEPLYAEPDDFTADRSYTAASTMQYADPDGPLYDEAVPVNRMLIPPGGT